MVKYADRFHVKSSEVQDLLFSELYCHTVGFKFACSWHERVQRIFKNTDTLLLSVQWGLMDLPGIMPVFSRELVTVCGGFVCMCYLKDNLLCGRIGVKHELPQQYNAHCCNPVNLSYSTQAQILLSRSSNVDVGFFFSMFHVKYLGCTFVHIIKINIWHFWQAFIF